MQHVSFKKINEPAIMLPFYGEYGWFLASFIRLVHYLQAPQKIVCCRKGEEIYFPSASGFYYDWKDIFSDNDKCGFRNTWPIGAVKNLMAEEVELAKKLNLVFPNFKQIRFDYPIPLNNIKDYDVPMDAPHGYDIPYLDVVICARHRNTTGKFGDNGIRNYPRWDEIVQSLFQAGYNIGIIGKSESSRHFKEINIASWNFPDNTAAIFQMLKQTQVYIGTDTGPTHLAALLRVPMMLFRCNLENLSPNTLTTSIIPIAKQEGFFAKLVEDGWDHPENVVREVSVYLQKN